MRQRLENMMRQRNCKTVTACSILLRYEDGGNSGLSRNSPGAVRRAPYTALETKRPISSLVAERQPEARLCPETHVPGESRPNKLGRD